MKQATYSTPADALREAAKRVGSQTALANALGRKKAAVSRWVVEQIPAEVCPEIERITGVPCEALRPDVSWAVLRKAA
jgi:DNA-binding transcriptional regulator YdaS (Cro superfamily)